MDDNDFWLPKEQLWLCIVADTMTHDQDFGDSYRIFDIYNTETCQQMERHILPVNNSPDFPWYIFQNTYEEKNQVVCTSGFEFTFCYDVENRELLSRMKPTFLLSRTSLDAQSGMTLNMAIYDHQAIIPTINMGDGNITITPLLPAPLAINPVIAKRVQNNRFQILTDLASKDKTKIAFDLQKKIRIDLPANMATQPVGKVLDYLKEQSR